MGAIHCEHLEAWGSILYLLKKLYSATSWVLITESASVRTVTHVSELRDTENASHVFSEKNLIIWNQIKLTILK